MITLQVLDCVLKPAYYELVEIRKLGALSINLVPGHDGTGIAVDAVNPLVNVLDDKQISRQTIVAIPKRRLKKEHGTDKPDPEYLDTANTTMTEGVEKILS